MSRDALASRIDAAIAALDAAMAEGPEVRHAEIQAAARAVIAVRDQAIEDVRAGAAEQGVLDQTNALVSLSYGAEFPLSGLHLRRLKQAREGLHDLRDQPRAS